MLIIKKKKIKIFFFILFINFNIIINIKNIIIKNKINNLIKIEIIHMKLKKYIHHYLKILKINLIKHLKNIICWKHFKIIIIIVK
jgi:hypothetical protein